MHDHAPTNALYFDLNAYAVDVGQHRAPPQRQATRSQRLANLLQAQLLDPQPLLVLMNNTQLGRDPMRSPGAAYVRTTDPRFRQLPLAVREALLKKARHDANMFRERWVSRWCRQQLDSLA
jgi:hypothetical protein